MIDNDAPLLLDVTRLIWRRWNGTIATGIDRICWAWLEHYGAQSQAVIIHRRGQAILPMTTSQAVFRLLDTSQKRSWDVLRFRAEFAALVIRRGYQLRGALAGRGRFWLNAGHTGLDVPDIGAWARRRCVRPVYLVHDLIPITHPQYCREGERERHEKRMLTVLETASGVVVNSAHTLESLEVFALQEGRAMPASAVAWPGNPELPSVVTRDPGEPTFVVLGTIEGRKNHRLLLSIWQDLVATLGSAAPKLVIVGRRGWRADDVFDTLDNHDFKGKVVELGALDDDRLSDVLRSARALLFPSFAEGFGIPLTEALAIGVPVIASDLTVFKEIGQGVPTLLPPTDQSAWTAAILDFAKPGSQSRAEQLTRLSKFRVPQWTEHFELVNRFLKTLK
ncbi:MAG: glycosyltransferase family 4 protein [Erythrobacter sp.]